MVSTFTVRAVVLIGLLTFIARVKAQGYLYEDTTSYCSGAGFQYLGCYQVSTSSQDPFGYTPGVPLDINGNGDPSISYIEYDNNDYTNATVNSHFCSRFCRHHGFHYTSLYNGGCSCGSTISSFTLASSEASCNNQCTGDRKEQCGTSNYARIFADLSYKKETDLGTISNVQTGYQKLGCFYGPGGGPNMPGPTLFQSTATTAATCFTTCATLRLPLARVVRYSSSSYKCYCGADFGFKQRAYDDTADSLCQVKCSDGTTGCTGQDCCGNGNNNVAPVYVNPDLLGCYVPRIPGVVPTAVDAIPATAYTCFPTPAFINGRNKQTVDYASPTLSRSASLVATATPAAGIVYSPYGCFNGHDSSGNALPSLVVGQSTVPAASLPTADANTCIKYCYSQGKNYVVLRSSDTASSSNPSTCICGTGLAAALGNHETMGSCNRPCSGNDNVLCGWEGTDGGLIYINQAEAAVFSQGPWYTQYTSTWALTPTYSCTPTTGTSRIYFPWQGFHPRS
ncbi:putative WSC domain-containing protein [Seiridium unicorne]|uniref:WSC domain-containing protein n=1 Tax=Seiridium unicorne TaxID=138068 RepID=A0ABR2UYP1_9PEZI